MSGQHTAETVNEEIQITNLMYCAYGTDTGILFGIPADLRGSVEAVVKIAISDFQDHIDRLEAEKVLLKKTVVGLRETQEVESYLRLEAEKAELVELVQEQAEDEALWFITVNAAEAYLQQELRRLHAVIEGKMIAQSAKAEPPK